MVFIKLLFRCDLDISVKRLKATMGGAKTPYYGVGPRYVDAPIFLYPALAVTSICASGARGSGFDKVNEQEEETILLDSLQKTGRIS